MSGNCRIELVIAIIAIIAAHWTEAIPIRTKLEGRSLFIDHQTGSRLWQNSRRQTWDDKAFASCNINIAKSRNQLCCNGSSDHSESNHSIRKTQTAVPSSVRCACFAGASLCGNDTLHIVTCYIQCAAILQNFVDMVFSSPSYYSGSSRLSSFNEEMVCFGRHARGKECIR